jgi:hypothetical protein
MPQRAQFPRQLFQQRQQREQTEQKPSSLSDSENGNEPVFNKQDKIRQNAQIVFKTEYTQIFELTKRFEMRVNLKDGRAGCVPEEDGLVASHGRSAPFGENNAMSSVLVLTERRGHSLVQKLNHGTTGVRVLNKSEEEEIRKTQRTKKQRDANLFFAAKVLHEGQLLVLGERHEHVIDAARSVHHNVARRKIQLQKRKDELT